MPKTLQAPRLAVGALIFDEDRVLLIQRGKEPRKGFWSVPGGGVELGETLTQALLREVREETGLTVRVGPLVCMYQWMERNRRGQVTHHHVVADHLCSVAGGQLDARDDAANARFMTLDEAARVPTTDGLLPVLSQAWLMSRRRAAAPKARPVRVPGAPGWRPRSFSGL